MPPVCIYGQTMRGGEKIERSRGEGREKARRRLREGCEKGERKQGEGRENARKIERGKNRYYRNGYDIKQDIVYLTIYEK